MSTKTNIQKTTDQINQAAANAGLALMAAATTIGLVQLPTEPDKKVIVPTNKPAFATVDNVPGYFEENQLRRERDEIHPQSISYSVNQRTPGRAGRI